MTKVSTRHLNEVVRERNQYSRDAIEAWQDYINLKGRMDTEVGKVTKRNNFLVEELENWRQQLLKFQATVGDLTGKSQALQTTIEGHKRENRRLAQLIDQQRTDADRLNDRLVGTSKQRDDALQALAVEKETRAELERERQRNKKEVAALQQNQAGILRQRDDAQRVVLHLHSLIEGQSHHMQHIVKDLQSNPRRQQNGTSASAQHPDSVLERVEASAAGLASSFRETFGLDNHPYNSASDAEDTLPSASSTHRNNHQSDDEADRDLRDKTESIAYILRNISEQCAVAVSSLQLAQRSATPAPAAPAASARDFAHVQSDAGVEPSLLGGDAETVLSDSRLSTPPTPDLVEHGQGGDRNSSSGMSMTTEGTFRDSAGPEVLLGRYDGQPMQFGGSGGKGVVNGRHGRGLRGESVA